MADGIKLTGDTELMNNLRRIQKEQPKKFSAGLFKRANVIMTISKRDHVPVDLGALMNSGRVEAPVITSGRISVAMVYGGNAAPYAIVVHEHPSGFSPPSWGGSVVFSPSGRGPGFLRIPMNQASRTFAADLAKDVGL